MKRGSFWGWAAPVGIIVLFGSFTGIAIMDIQKKGDRMSAATTKETRPYIEEYRDCTQGERGQLECKAALTEAARENEGEALARQVADDIDECHRAACGDSRSAPADEG